MIDSRVIELLKSPQQIKAQDLKLVSKEIGKYPYVQSLRALYLLGTHLHEKDQYPAVLHTTAAYTTDKKILYHFINKESKEEVPQQASEPSIGNSEQSDSFSRYQAVLPKEKRVLPIVHINGERNRILFEGEENFLQQESPKIDWEQTEESGKVSSFSTPVTSIPPVLAETVHKNEEVLANEPTLSENAESKQPNDLSDENSADLSFQDVDSFLPQVPMPSKAKPDTFLPKQASDRHQDEMQKLIAEVEAKIKAKKESGKEVKIVEESEATSVSSQVNFSQVSDFNFSAGSSNEENSAEESPNKFADKPTVTSVTPVTEVLSEQRASKASEPWKPMVFPGQQILRKEPSAGRDESKESAIKQTEQVPLAAINLPTHKQQEVESSKADMNQDSMPALNAPSNIPEFINTWQSWLKIDRTQGELTSTPQLLSIDQVRNKAIDTFIETQPKISRLKEESSFAIKEKPDDISHLMTETLVGLYVEQRLYAKAIQGYEVLQEKYPEKFEEYSEKIEQVKLRK